MGHYYYWAKLDYDRALQELALARERQPNNADVFMAIASVERRQGRWTNAIADFERGVQLNPRSSDAIGNLAETYFVTRKYELAHQIGDKAKSIAPDVAYPYWIKVQSLIAVDSLRQAKQTLREALKSVDFVEMIRPAAGIGAIGSFAVEPAFMLVGDTLYQSKIEQLTLGEFVDTVGYYHLKAQLFGVRGRAGLQRAYLDSARTALESLVQAHPEEANFHARLGLVYAGLGRNADAVREGRAAVKLLPVSREAYRGANMQAALAMIYATVGMRTEAIEQLKYLLSIPSQVNPGLLRYDPRWDGLRGDERFERLVR
jgi:tetratricopeptide (TPR) repeat protein